MPVERPLPAHVRQLIIGSGFAGIGTAIKLAESGRTDFAVIEKGPRVGGTWRDNTYPGAACDVPSQLYSFSFALNPNWSRSFSPQPEIQAYLERVAKASGTLDRFWFDTAVEEAAWDEDAGHWTVTTTAGSISADVLISGSGGLSAPKLPDIEGIGDFAGAIFHTARWNHDVDLTGRRVAVIGTGASAIQIIPEVAKVASHLDVYQRTAPWVIPRTDRGYTRLERAGFRAIPGLQRLYRTAIYWGREGFVPAFTWKPALAKPAKLAALGNIARGISDPVLRAKVTPDFEIGCKRILISNSYYPTLARDEVDLITTPIQRITADAIITADGVEHPVDAIVVATGFFTTDQPIAHHIKGRDGQTLAETWAAGGQSAYKGTTVSGFPNFFQIVGPNTVLGHSSMVFIIESQIRYILDGLQTMDSEGLGTVEPTPAAQTAWNADVQRRMGRTVWNTGGCASWYLDEHGRNTTLWPRATFTFRNKLRQFDRGAYAVTRRRATTPKETIG